MTHLVIVLSLRNNCNFCLISNVLKSIVSYMLSIFISFLLLFFFFFPFWPKPKHSFIFDMLFFFLNLCWKIYLLTVLSSLTGVLDYIFMLPINSPRAKIFCKSKIDNVSLIFKTFQLCPLKHKIYAQSIGMQVLPWSHPFLTFRLLFFLFLSFMLWSN